MTRRSLLLTVAAWPILALATGVFAYRSITTEAITTDFESTATVAPLTRLEEMSSPVQAIRRDALESAIAIGLSIPTGIYLLFGLRILARKFSENLESRFIPC
jgi:hypothetical protein